jgi:hypothetical protein
MTRNLKKIFAAGFIVAVAGLSSGPLSNAAQVFDEAVDPGCVDANPIQEVTFCRIGDATGFIPVISDNNTTWTTVPPATIVFSVHILANPRDETLNTVRVFQGAHMIHHPNVHDHKIYQYNGVLHGHSLHLSDAEKAQLVAICNETLNPAAANQQEHQYPTNITLIRTMSTEEHNGIRHDQTPVADEWPVTVKCLPFKREISVDANSDDSHTVDRTPTTRSNTDNSNVPGAVITGHMVKPVVDPVSPNPRHPVYPGVVTTGHNNKAADIIRKRNENARRKAAEAAAASRKKVESELRRKAAAAALAKRKAEAHRKAAAAAIITRHKAAVAVLARQRAAAVSKRRVAWKRRTIAPVRAMRLCRR